MTQAVRLTTRAEREALRSIKRVCYAGLDSLTLRQEVGRRAADIVPADSYALMSTDPDTGLFTHGWGERLSERFVESYVTSVYPHEIDKFIDLAQSGRTLSTAISDPFQDVLRANGLEHALHVALCSGDGIYGSWCLFREGASRAFGERESRFMRAIAPHVAQGMEAAARTEAALHTPPSAAPAAPGIVVLDPRGRIAIRNGSATEQLADLADVGMLTDRLPYAVISVLARLRGVHTRPDGPIAAELRAQGRSGCRYTLRASLAEPDAAGEASTMIVIERAARREPSLLLSRTYPLTPRERDVLLLVIRGESTKGIASRLALSVYTIQDHLDRVCEKVGVRGRKALLAKLFFDGSAPAAGA